MDARLNELTRRFDGSKLIGYLNYSDGRPDPRFRRGLADAFAGLEGVERPWETIATWLTSRANELKASGASAYSDPSQALAVIPATFLDLPRAYREYHQDLLAHNSDETLFNAFFFARGAEAVLRSRANGTADDKLSESAVRTISDYVGYRPVAILETGQPSEIDPHERIAPIPLYFAGSEAAPGKYAEIVAPALKLLKETDRELLDEAMLEPDLIEELALDPRAVDHLHPINKRPNFLFGEWDPHRIDGQGNYRRFVVRQLTIDSLIAWVTPGPAKARKSPDAIAERRFEAAAVLAGTVLMGAGICGSGPTSFDSETTLTKLVPRIARYRDEFYKKLLAALPGSHGDRLREEAERLKQPFAAVRQFLNQAIASERALHLQERRLALLFAGMGYPNAARTRASRITAPAVRLLCEIRLRHAEIALANREGRLTDSSNLLKEVEDVLKRGIACGALIDPWTILGFQGLYPIFAGREDTVRDPRAEDVILTVGRQFDLYAQALATATTSDMPLAREELANRMRSLSDWWDKFATPAVSDLPKVHGGDRTDAAEHVSRALGLWKQGGASDPSFWRKHREGFKSPAAFAQVIDALIAHGDYRAAMALLVTWLSEADDVPLQDPAASFVRLAFRWLRGVATTGTVSPAEKGPLVRRFFELLEVNADDRWLVPELRPDLPTKKGKPRRPVQDEGDGEGEDDTFSSAYEGMTYRDSTDDGYEGSVHDGNGPSQPDFALEGDSERTEDRLRFVAAVARLWRAAVRIDLWPRHDSAAATAISHWLNTANANLQQLLQLLERIDEIPVPNPIGGVEGVMEYDRRRVIKGNLLEIGVATVVETAAAARALTALLARAGELPRSHDPHDFITPAPVKPVKPTKQIGDQRSTHEDLPDWEPIAARIDQAILTGDVSNVRKLIPAFAVQFKNQPLLVHPTSDGGPPTAAARTQTALHELQSLLARLPKLGLIRETFQLLKLAKAMERYVPPSGRRVSSFDQLFRTALNGTIEAVLTSAEAWRSSNQLAKGDEDGSNGPLAIALRTIVETYFELWKDHNQSIRLSVLEVVLATEEWTRLKSFIRTYGGDLFTGRFLTVANVRGILRRGVGAWMDQLADPEADTDGAFFGTSEEPTERPRLAEHWKDEEVNKTDAAMHLETVFQALVEHYDEYRDYNTTTTQSDYGENLYILLDFLRLKVAYNRYAWELIPWTVTHDVLCRRGFDQLAARWQEAIAAQTQDKANELLKELAAKEIEHGIRLRTVRDRLEERFLQPLQIDRAVARISHATAAAREGRDESNPAFVALLEAVKPLAEIPTGVGLDVPVWLRRLEEEHRKEQGVGTESPLDDEAESDTVDPAPPVIKINFENIIRQLKMWNKPISIEEES
ncbi:MAG: hypothetical protein U0798_11915 [Gemmataceae bacterium]